MNKPFKLKPIFKDYIWGGQRLIDDYHKDTNINPCAESWEFSTHEAGISFVDSGEHKGLDIKTLFKKHPEYLGRYKNEDGEIPILIKLIDAKSDLSIQVHPSDEYALAHENSLGKTEVWYLLDSNNGHLAVGFKEDVNKEIVKNAINDNSICDYINYFNVKKDEFYPIEAGTVHAIGGGCLLAEIQENSNLTYRLYDYDRKDKNGNKRELHIDKALDVLNYSKYNKPNQNNVNYECKYFKLNKIEEPCSIETNKENFVVLLCMGSSYIKCEDEIIETKIGESVFVPSECKIEVKGKFLKVEV